MKPAVLAMLALSAALLAPPVKLFSQAAAPAPQTTKELQDKLKNDEKANKEKAKAARDQRKALRQQDKAEKAARKADQPKE